MTMFDTLQAWFGSVRKSAGRGTGERLSSTGDRLNVRRHQRLREGFVSLPARPAMPPQLCRVEDVSFNGARIAFDGKSLDPSTWASGVRLYLATENIEVDCSVAWQRGEQLGLHFLGQPHPPTRDYR